MGSIEAMIGREMERMETEPVVMPGETAESPQGDLPEAGSKAAGSGLPIERGGNSTRLDEGTAEAESQPIREVRLRSEYHTEDGQLVQPGIEVILTYKTVREGQETRLELVGMKVEAAANESSSRYWEIYRRALEYMGIGGNGDGQTIEVGPDDFQQIPDLSGRIKEVLKIGEPSESGQVPWQAVDLNHVESVVGRQDKVI